MSQVHRRALAATIAAATLATFGAVQPTAVADEAPAPTAHYDMSHTGSTLLDVSGNARHASLTGFTDASFVAAGADDVLRFRSDGYATLPKGLVTGTDNDFAVEFTVTTQTAANQFGWVIGDGVGAWNTTALGNHVFVNPRTGESAYSNQVLSGIRVKTGTGNGEVRLPAGGGLNPGMTTLTLVGEGNRLTLYRDGAQISTNTHTYSMASIIPAGDRLGYLGRSLYTGDALLTGDVTDVKFWDQALTAEQVGAAMPTGQEKAAATEALVRLDLEPRMLGSNPSLDEVRTDLSFPASISGIGVTWTTSNPAVVSATGTVSRQAADTAVTVTATLSNGTVVPFEVVVKASSAIDDLDSIALLSRTTENLPLITAGATGATIVWTSSDEILVTGTDPDYAAPAAGGSDPFRGGGIITRPAYGSGDAQVSLTATATLHGVSEQRTFEVTIAEQGRSAPDAGYAAAYFKSDSDEKIYQAATTGNDFFTFQSVNGGRPVIASTVDAKGLRDPYILRSAQGDKYYMVATDLCIGCGTGWGPAQSAGSLKIHVWESADLVNWTRTNDEDAGITVNQPEAGMTWAPEVYWDDDLQSYVVFFSSRLYSDATHSNSDNLYARVFYVMTRDFRTFTYPPVKWQDTGYARIDSTIQKIGDYYYRFTKNEESGAAGILEAGKDIFLERSKVLTSVTTQSNWNADPESTWQLTDTRMTSLETGQSGEGPQIVKLNEGDPNNDAGNDGYVFLVDNYAAGGYRAFVTSGDEIASSSQADRLSKRADWNVRPVGGLPSSPRHGAFVNVTQAVLDAMHSWTALSAVDSTTTLSIDGRTATATVIAEDEGDVVGTVTFSGGDWSETVALVDGAASVEVPSGVADVVASYDGYSDGLVSPSTSETLSLQVGFTAQVATRCVAGKVVQVVTVKAEKPLTGVTVTSGYGSRSLGGLLEGRSGSAAFSTRLAAIPAGQVGVTATVGGIDVTVSAGSPAATCG